MVCSLASVGEGQMADVTDEGASRTHAPSTLGSRLRYAGPGIVIAVTGVGLGTWSPPWWPGRTLEWSSCGLSFSGRSSSTFYRGNRALVHGLWADHLAGLAFAWPVGDLVFRGLSVHRDLRLRGRGNLDRCTGCGRGVPRCASAVGLGRAPQRGGFRRRQHRALRFVRKYHEDLRRPEVRYRYMLAILLAPSLGEVVLGFVPRIPEGALINVLAIIGGVGGTYSLAAYTYWVRERGWRHSAWIPTMRTDLTFGYALTALFMVSMLIIGAELLFGTGTSISDEEGLLALVDPLQDRFGL